MFVLFGEAPLTSVSDKMDYVQKLSACPRLVRRGGDDRSLAGTGNGYGLAPEGRVVPLLYRGKKGVHVNAGNDSGHP